MRYKVCHLLDRFLNLKYFLLLLLLRCPIDALMTILYAVFLKGTFQSMECGNRSLLFHSCFFYLFASILLFVYNGTIWHLYATFSIHAVTNLRLLLSRTISRLDLWQLEKHTHAEWLTFLNSDLQLTCNLFYAPLNFPHAVVSIVNLAVSSILLFSTNHSILFFALLFLIPHLLISQIFTAQPILAKKQDSQKRLEQNTLDLDPLITAADAIRLYDAEDLVLAQFETSSRELLHANMKIHRLLARKESLLPLFGLTGYLVILLIGARSIAAGDMTFGTLTAALQYRGGLVQGSALLISCLLTIRTNLTGAHRMNQMLEENESR